MDTKHTVKLGSTGPEVFRLGLGCMGMSGMYGAADEAESLRTIHAALERGVTLLDTGDFYGMGHNELLVGRAIAGRREKVQLSVKFGAMRGPDGSWGGMDLRPVAVKNFAAYSLKRLGVDVIDIYRPARLDPNVPIEETVGAIAELVKAGYVRHIALSEVGAETVRRAQRVHPIVDVQLEYSLASRGPEANLFPALRELGVGATLYGVLSRGLLTGSKPTGAGDFRAHLPRFSGEHRATNEASVQALHRFAQERDLSPAQLAIAWVLARQPGFVPIIGARRVAQVEDALAALARPLSREDVSALESLVAFTGERYGAEQMHMLDSERP
ncbi:aldo/keto reductase [Myxococcus faecalis]|jgi:aryl-alcohol dehydrogenase-like predicted oxidoreductase|uniref:aldo/keto reductase n=1 Tax=Myxococcus TaxID=32 RepID=UPI001CC009F3|nr:MULTISPECIES: aldo/keto reductase [unclassified Myxococcus]MBZ4396944.1 aldo/keto reductase [Myxococcus sp. AS-1-15]MBZ4408330.1 aldo/keto reductase [Myxococcus sp. XM-1-1-1]BDT33428.1 aldo/keto reductase [Myxococcus sp. MH1]